MIRCKFKNNQRRRRVRRPRQPTSRCRCQCGRTSGSNHNRDAAAADCDAPATAAKHRHQSTSAFASSIGIESLALSSSSPPASASASPSTEKGCVGLCSGHSFVGVGVGVGMPMLPVRFRLLLLLLAAASALVGTCDASEFPERECCDSVYPTLPDLAVPPFDSDFAAVATAAGPESDPAGGIYGGSYGGGGDSDGDSDEASIVPGVIGVGTPGSNVKSTLSILNCILARQLCFEDPSCSAILEIIPRVCGPVPVACSTVTVTKCQAALKTLQAFPFFRPTCLCKEPTVDPDCNNFQNFLFDHPCGFVQKKEKDPYPVDALPTCNHALSVCQQERKCIKLFENFKTHCKVRDNKCRMDDRNLCHEAWTNLRLSPMFGCICPNNHMKRRCDRIFAMVNHNPCVVLSMSSADDGYRYDDLSMALLEMPLIASVSAHFERQFQQQLHHRHSGGYHHHNAPHSYPYNLSAATQHHHHHQQPPTSYAVDGGIGGGGIVGSDHPDSIPGASRAMMTPTTTTTNENSGNHPGKLERHQSASEQMPDSHTEIVRIHFQSTCHTALESCREDSSCASAVQPVLKHCDLHRCNRNACMDALKSFYRGAHEALSLDVAFCLCKKTSERHDICMSAQEKLHPVCAQRPPDIVNAQPTIGLGSGSAGSGGGGGSSGAMMYQPPPACHTIAETCKEDPECRGHLEHYEQSCAVDSVTLKCAGQSSACRKAMLGILGTPLRTTCACQTTETQQLYVCLGWHRLLWLNPCIVESQRDFHMQRLADLGLLETTTVTQATTTTTDAVTATTKTPPTMARKTTTAMSRAVTAMSATTTAAPTSQRAIRLPAATSKSLPAHGNGHTKNNHHDTDPMGRKKSKHIGRKKTSQDPPVEQVTQAVANRSRPSGVGGSAADVNVSDDIGSDFSDGNHAFNLDDDDDDDDDNDADDDDDDRAAGGGESDIDEQRKNAIRPPTAGTPTSAAVDAITLPKSTSTTTTTTTTTTTMASTLPPRYCVVQRPQQSDQLIPESSTRRIYSLDDSECSELCSCTDALTLSCHALCVPFAPCRTSLAFYSHASPAYQAFRGRCLCYSGRFICMRPAPGEYVLPGGVFLMLGYSSTDESLLRPYTNLGVQDAIRGLQHYVLRHIANQTLCSLTLFNMTDENIIISARLVQDPKVNPMELLRKEKAQCTGILEAISRQVNNQHSELAAHRLLSIFKMAEVQVVWPEVSGAAAAPLADLGRLSVRLAVLVVGVPIALRWLQLRDMDVRYGWVS